MGCLLAQEYERCARYILPACSRTAGRHIDQTFAILDAKGESLAISLKPLVSQWHRWQCTSMCAFSVLLPSPFRHITFLLRGSRCSSCAQPVVCSLCWQILIAGGHDSALKCHCTGVGIRHLTGSVKKMLGTVLQVQICGEISVLFR